MDGTAPTTPTTPSLVFQVPAHYIIPPSKRMETNEACSALEIDQKRLVLHFLDCLHVFEQKHFISQKILTLSICLLTKTKMQWRECRYLKRRGKDTGGSKKERGPRKSRSSELCTEAQCLWRTDDSFLRQTYHIFVSISRKTMAAAISVWHLDCGSSSSSEKIKERIFDSFCT